MIFYFSFIIFAATTVIGQSGSLNRASGPPNDVCTSKECKQGAYILQNSIDRNANPCDNFYKFACGQYPSVFSLMPKQRWRSWTNDLVDQIMRKVQNFLTLPPSDADPTVLNLLRGLYASCLDEDSMDKANYRGFNGLLDVMGLPILPIYAKEAKVDWIKMMAMAIQSGTTSFLFDVYVFGEANNQQVNTIYITKGSNRPILGYQWGFEVGAFELTKYPMENPSLVSNVDIPNFGTRNAGGTDPNEGGTTDADDQGRKPEEEEPPEMKVDTTKKPAFTTFTLAAMKLLQDHFEIDDVKLDDPQLLQDVDDLYNFLYRKDMIQSASYLDARQPKMTNLKTLQKKTDKIMRGSHLVNWTKLLNLTFNCLNPPYEFNEDDTIGILGLDYTRKALSLLAKTNGRIIAMGIWFETLQKFALVSTRELKELYLTYKQEIGAPEPPTQQDQCTRTIMSKYAYAISYMFTKEPGAFYKKYKVQVMTDIILRVFKQTLTKADWINPNTKMAALDKTSRMRSYVAFEWWLKYHGDVNNFYDGFPIFNNGFVPTIIMYNAVAKKYNFNNLFNRNHPDRPGYAMAPSVVNACYSPTTNSLTLPYAALNLPYYNYGIEALNYGSMGLVIAHEVTHGFDNSGKNYDLNGNGNPWMSKDTTKKFRDGAKCFVKSYGQLHLDELDVNVDGELTLNENIADNGGIAMAWEAYKIYRQKYRDKVLPGFETFTHEQLFTLGFAMSQCGHYSRSAFDYLIKDEHTPPEQRVNGLMMNFSEFPKIWGCSSDAPMNPSTKCKIW